MLLKLISLALLAHHVSACCLPDSFQVTVLSDSHYGDHNRFRAKIIMASDAASGRASIFSATESGQISQIYADFRSGRLLTYAPPYGCYESRIDPSLASSFNESRCVPANIISQPPIPINIAQRVNASLFSGRVAAYNTTLDALISDRCEPILVKVKGPGFRSINIFGDIHSAPLPGFMDPPALCRNATWVGGRKRGVVTLGYGTSPFGV